MTDLTNNNHCKKYDSIPCSEAYNQFTITLLYAPFEYKKKSSKICVYMQNSKSNFSNVTKTKLNLGIHWYINCFLELYLLSHTHSVHTMLLDTNDQL